MGFVPVVGRGPSDQHSQLQLWSDGPRNTLFTVLRLLNQPNPADPGSDSGPGVELAPWLDDMGLAGLLEAEQRGTIAALVQRGAPVIDLEIERLDASALAGLFVLFETAVALIGLMRGIDPFDQPGVLAAKAFASGLLGFEGAEAQREQAEELLAAPGADVLVGPGEDR